MSFTFTWTFPHKDLGKRYYTRFCNTSILRLESIRRPLYSNLVPRVVVPLVSSRERETLVESKKRPYLIGC